MAQAQFDVFQVVADPSRRQILYLLMDESMSINALAEHFEMSRPAVSKHIKILEAAGFISITDIGRERYCMLKQDGFTELQDWVSYFDNFWLKKMKTLESILEKRLGKKH